MSEAEKNIDDVKVVEEFILRISFADDLLNFTQIDWSLIEDTLNNISSVWKFLTFSVDYRSADISVIGIDVYEEFSKIIVIKSAIETYDVLIQKVKSGSKKAIIYSLALVPMTKKNLLIKLKTQGVVNLHKLEKIDGRNGVKYYTASIVLIFENSDLLRTIKIGSLKLNLSIINPKPMFCTHCGFFGHTFKRCKLINIITCNVCFFTHGNNEKCINICKNCKGNHLSTDKDCPVYLDELEILRLKDFHNSNYLDARSLVINGKDSEESNNIEKRTFEEVVQECKTRRAELRREIELKACVIEERDILIDEVKELRSNTIANLELELNSSKTRCVEILHDSKQKDEQIENFKHKVIEVEEECQEELVKMGEDLLIAKEEIIKLKSEAFTLKTKLRDCAASNKTIADQYKLLEKSRNDILKEKNDIVLEKSLLVTKYNKLVHYHKSKIGTDEYTKRKLKRGNNDQVIGKEGNTSFEEFTLEEEEIIPIDDEMKDN